MTKFSWVALFCFILASGCALPDSVDVTLDQPSPPSVAAESQAEPVPLVIEAAPPKTPSAATRNVTRDDLRRMQSRLREVGLDPGPVDGIPGPKTKAAFDRFQAGCASVDAVIEQWGAAAQSPPGQAKGPDRPETRLIQSQLKNAGFNPGPIDGVFGSRTRSLLLQLNDSCPMVADFAQTLAQATAQADALASAPAAWQNRAGELSRSPISASNDAPKRTIASQPARSQEEVRILQLRLKDAGFDPGPFDGVMGPKTRAALEQYQASGKGKATTVVSRFGGQY